MDKKELKRIANELRPEFNIGKNGITQTFVDSIKKYLEAHEIVKIKVSVAEDKNAMLFYSGELAKETDSEVVEIKGRTFVLIKEV